MSGMYIFEHPHRLRRDGKIMTDRKGRVEIVPVWYLATCQECGDPDPAVPRLPQPFSDEKQRDAWAKVHRTATGHTVTETTEPRP